MTSACLLRALAGSQGSKVVDQRRGLPLSFVCADGKDAGAASVGLAHQRCAEVVVCSCQNPQGPCASALSDKCLACVDGEDAGADSRCPSRRRTTTAREAKQTLLHALAHARQPCLPNSLFSRMPCLQTARMQGQTQGVPRGGAPPPHRNPSRMGSSGTPSLDSNG